MPPATRLFGKPAGRRRYPPVSPAPRTVAPARSAVPPSALAAGERVDGAPVGQLRHMLLRGRVASLLVIASRGWGVHRRADLRRGGGLGAVRVDLQAIPFAGVRKPVMAELCLAAPVALARSSWGASCSSPAAGPFGPRSPRRHR